MSVNLPLRLIQHNEWGSGSTTPRICNIGVGWRRVACFTLSHLTSEKIFLGRAG